jgi:hypothetical protein
LLLPLVCCCRTSHCLRSLSFVLIVASYIFNVVLVERKPVDVQM